MRRRTATFGLLVALSVFPQPASAQRMTRPPVRPGEATGLEMAIEGRTSAVPGSRLRWLLTAYEVVGQTELRPAPGASVRVAASFRPEEALAELTTDRYGRARLDTPVPADLDEPFRVVVDLVSASRIRRRFVVDVTLEPTRAVELRVDRSSCVPGLPVRFWGRVLATASGRAVEGEEVSVRLEDPAGRPLRPALRLRSGPAGVFAGSVPAPDGPGPVRFVARHVDGGLEASAAVSPARPSRPDLVVRATPARPVVAPGETVEVDVSVTRRDGRPVAGAFVEPPGRGPRGGPAVAPLRTDASGRARFAFRPEGAPPAGGAVDVAAEVRAVRTGLGSGAGRLVVRLARSELLVGVSVEGGALVPGVAGRVYLRLARAAGGPVAAGVPVRIESGRLGAHDGVTGPGGVAVLEVVLRAASASDPDDGCGGGSATSATLEVGSGPEATEVRTCLPVDPDGTLRVRAAPAVARAGGELRVTVERAAAVRRAPVVVSLLSDRRSGLHPIAQSVLPAGESETTLALPADVTGQVLVRARPLVGPAADEVRGGSALVLSTGGGPLELEVRQAGPDAVSLEVSAASEPARGHVVVLPRLEGEALLARIAASAGPLERLGPNPPEALVEGTLAALVPADLAAPALLRGREVVPAPAPGDPVRHGVLRDPARARARFLRGRLGIVMRAIEQYVARAVPGRIDDVLVRGPRGNRFNDELLSAVRGSDELGLEGARGLGGEPLRLADLEALDSAITYDAVARRVTRERLVRVLVALRSLVHDRQLDLGLALRGEPGQWLAELRDRLGGGIDEEPLDQRALHDGWGRLFQVRPARGGRARFALIAPLPAGYELVSAGPDGRFDTADDLYDPLARVLPSRSAYAEAVGEDSLLARLRGVELSRATVARLGELFETRLESPATEPGEGTLDLGWWALPAPVDEAPSADRFERSWVPSPGFGSGVVDLREGRARVLAPLGDEPRRYLAVATAWTAAGERAHAACPLEAGLPFLLEVELPARLRLGEPVTVPVGVVRLDGAPGRLELEATGSGAVRAALAPRGPTPLEGPEAAPAVLLEGIEPGRGRVRLVLRGGGLSSVVEAEVLVDDGALLRSQVAGAALQGSRRLALELPADARVGGRAALFVTAPASLATDPAFARLVSRDPALVGWALALGRGELTEAVAVAVRAAVHGRSADSDPLAAACALVALAGLSAEDEAAARERAAVLSEVLVSGAPARRGRSVAELSDPSARAYAARQSASVLAALATTAGPAGALGTSRDPLARLVDGLRAEVRGALRAHSGEPATMARAAAALLVVDPGDARGRAMLEAARGSLEPGLRGGLVLAGEDGSMADSVAATAALAVAARQVGDSELVEALGAGLAARLHLAAALGGEAAFWALAASVYGVFGVGELSSVTVAVDRGEPRTVELRGGRAVVPIELPEPGRGRSVTLDRTDASPVAALVRLEGLYPRSPSALEGSPLRARLDGDPGEAGGTAAFEVTVENTGASAEPHPVLLVSLPAAAVVEDRTLLALAHAPGIASVEPPDLRGVLRIDLRPLGAGARAELPLTLRWLGTGRFRGLALSAFAADRPWELSVSPEVELEVRGAGAR